MMTFILALAAVSPTAVQASGMEPQLRIIRQAAAERTWPITCVGHSGEEGVVRIAIPAGTPDAAVNSFIVVVKSVASSFGNHRVDRQSCDETPPLVEGGVPVRHLVFTTERDQGLLSVAQECGYSKAFWRSTTPDDTTGVRGRLATKKYPNTLDAGENAAARNGPLMCFLAMSARLRKSDR